VCTGEIVIATGSQFTITKTSRPEDTAFINTNIIYTITVVNNGGSSSVDIVDDLPGTNADFIITNVGGGNPNFTSHTLSWENVTIANGTSTFLFE